MVHMSKRSLASTLLLSCVFYTTSVHAGVTKKAQEVFAKWLEWQVIMPDKDLREMADFLDADRLRKQYVNAIVPMQPLNPLLHDLTAGQIADDGFVLRNPLPDKLKENFKTVYELMQNDIPAFLNYVGEASVIGSDNIATEVRADSNKVIEKYMGLSNMLFSHPDVIEGLKYQFTLANKFFEFAFEQKTFPAFERILATRELQPLGRLLYSITWHNLAGQGWKHWHENALKTLKDRADQGHTIKYIAGGSDLFQLIKAGVYNIKNIDPQLPTQPKYYANGWDFLMRGDVDDNNGIGDKIEFNFTDKTVVMERTDFKLTGEIFKARINTGEIVELPRSITTWTISDDKGEKLGSYQLDRRFCMQQDFNTAPNETLLMSFNELYFIALPSFLDGWLIDPAGFSPDTEIVVKQLRKPVNRETVQNMRIGSLINASDFKFIALGTCIN